MATPIDKFLIIYGAYSGLSDEGRGVVQRVNSVIPEILGESGLTVGFSGIGNKSSINKSLISEIFEGGMIHALPGGDLDARGSYSEVPGASSALERNAHISLNAEIFNGHTDIFSEGYEESLNTRFFTALKTTMHEIGHAASSSTGAKGETRSASLGSERAIIDSILDPYISEIIDSSERGRFSLRRKSKLSLSVKEINNVQKNYKNILVRHAQEEARAEGFAYEALSRIGSSFAFDKGSGLIVPSYSMPKSFRYYEELSKKDSDLARRAGANPNMQSLLETVFERFAGPDVMNELEGPLTGKRGLHPADFVSEMGNSSRLSAVGTIHGGLRGLSDEGFTQLFEQVNYRPADAMDRYFPTLLSWGRDKAYYSPDRIMSTIMEASDASFNSNRRVLLGDASSILGEVFEDYPVGSTVAAAERDVVSRAGRSLDVASGRMSTKTFQMVADSVKTAIRVRT